MTLTGLVDLFCTEPTITETIGDARVRRLPVLDVTAPAPMRPLIAAALSAAADRGGASRPVLLVSSTFREAEELTAALSPWSARMPWPTTRRGRRCRTSD